MIALLIIMIILQLPKYIMSSQSSNVAEGQTDGRTDRRHNIATLRYARST